MPGEHIEFKKMLEAAKIPTAAFILINLIGWSVLSGYVFILEPLGLLIFAYAGYVAVKRFNLDLLSAALTGSITALLSGILSVIIVALLVYTGGAYGIYMYVAILGGLIWGATGLPVPGAQTDLWAFFVLVAMMYFLFNGVLIGLISGFIGGLIGKYTRLGG